jgi:hypothetical protein
LRQRFLASVVCVATLAWAGSACSSDQATGQQCRLIAAGDSAAISTAAAHPHDRPDGVEFDPLACAIRSGRPSVVEQLLDAGYDPSYLPPDNPVSILRVLPSSPSEYDLTASEMNDYVEIVRKLVASGLDPCADGAPGQDTYSLMLERGWSVGAEILRKAGATCDTT